MSVRNAICIWLFSTCMHACNTAISMRTMLYIGIACILCYTKTLAGYLLYSHCCSHCRRYCRCSYALCFLLFFLLILYIFSLEIEKSRRRRRNEMKVFETSANDICVYVSATTEEEEVKELKTKRKNHHSKYRTFHCHLPIYTCVLRYVHVCVICVWICAYLSLYLPSSLFLFSILCLVFKWIVYATQHNIVRCTSKSTRQDFIVIFTQLRLKSMPYKINTAFLCVFARPTHIPVEIDLPPIKWPNVLKWCNSTRATTHTHTSILYEHYRHTGTSNSKFVSFQSNQPHHPHLTNLHSSGR